MSLVSERDMAERFQRETARHEMTILHDDGLYRHLRARKPGSGLYWFDIVTWPGSLAIRGDINSAYVFSRMTDMFEFFQGSRDGRINPDYWAEKLPEGRRSAQAYSENLLLWHMRHALREEYEDFLASRLAEKAKEFGLADVDQMWPELTKPCHRQARDHMRKLRTAVRAHFFDDWWGCGTQYEDAVQRGLDEFSFVDDGHKFQFEGWQEWDLRDWDWSFLWACHAIVWGIAQYDRLGAAAPGGGR